MAGEIQIEVKSNIVPTPKLEPAVGDEVAVIYDDLTGETRVEPVEESKIHWEVFSRIFIRDKGFPPNQRDRFHREQYYWFTRGAQSELNGELDLKPGKQPASSKGPAS